MKSEKLEGMVRLLEVSIKHALQEVDYKFDRQDAQPMVEYIGSVIRKSLAHGSGDISFIASHPVTQAFNIFLQVIVTEDKLSYKLRFNSPQFKDEICKSVMFLLNCKNPEDAKSMPVSESDLHYFSQLQASRVAPLSMTQSEISFSAHA